MKILDDFSLTLLKESLLYDDTKIKDKINNYNKPIASDQDLLNKFKSITGYEILGLPITTTVSKYGLEVAKNYSLYCHSGKKVNHVSLSAACLVNQNISNLKCTSVKTVKFNKNNNIDTFFKIMDKCKNKAAIQHIGTSSKKITITFYQCNKNFIESLADKDINIKVGKMLNRLTIYNDINKITESANDNLNELSGLAGMNPIKTTNKCFILNMTPMTSIFGVTKFALTSDILSDKYFVVTEDGFLDVVEQEYLDDYSYSIYEFVGNKLLLGKIYETYENKTQVGPDYIYNELSGNKLYTDGQIMHDKSFRHVKMEDYGCYLDL